MPTCGAKRYSSQHWNAVRESNEIKDNNSGKGRDVMSASGSIRARSLTGIYYLMIGDVCRDNYFLENRKDIIEI